jgi:hypothetical protein
MARGTDGGATGACVRFCFCCVSSFSFSMPPFSSRKLYINWAVSLSCSSDSDMPMLLNTAFNSGSIFSVWSVINTVISYNCITYARMWQAYNSEQYNILYTLHNFDGKRADQFKFERNKQLKYHTPARSSITKLNTSFGWKLLSNRIQLSRKQCWNNHKVRIVTTQRRRVTNCL